MMIRERRSLPTDRLFAARGSASNVMQAFAAGLQRDTAAYAAGREDGETGADFRPQDHDVFSYACGFQAGRQFPKRGG
jgi:hypothetical protein